jgi:hypothetical protein
MEYNNHQSCNITVTTMTEQAGFEELVQAVINLAPDDFYMSIKYWISTTTPFRSSDLHISDEFLIHLNRQGEEAITEVMRKLYHFNIGDEAEEIEETDDEDEDEETAETIRNLFKDPNARYSLEYKVYERTFFLLRKDVGTVYERVLYKMP